MSEQLADGYYRISDDEGAWIEYMVDGVFGDDKAEWYLEEGYELTPVVVLSVPEHAALLAEVEALRAQVAEKEAHIEHLTEINTIAAQTISTLQDYRTSLTAQVARLQGEVTP